MSETRSPLHADLVLVAVTLVAAAGWIFSKEALSGLPPLLFVGVRFLLAGVVLALFGWRQLRALDRSGWRGGFIIGFLFSLAMTMWIIGLQQTTHLGEGGFISSLGVVLVPLMGRLFFGERPPPTVWLAMALALVGFGFLSLGQGFHFEPSQWLFLATAVIFAFLVNMNGRVVRNVSPVALSAVQVSVVGFFALPLSLLFESWPTSVSAPILGWLLASALIATTLRFVLQLYGQSLTSPSHAALILMLEPMWIALTAAWWFGERMNGQQLVGCSLIFSALLLSRWRVVRDVTRDLLRRSLARH
ncbi:MAG: DMT family transporter [Thauera sp.]|jgi:drug/metabolite transporter (DMT)-like permease|nr:DMT family transporter [Thauera sp.]